MYGIKITRRSSGKRSFLKSEGELETWRTEASARRFIRDYLADDDVRAVWKNPRIVKI